VTNESAISGQTKDNAMLRRLTGQANACRQRAILAEFRAVYAANADVRRHYRRVARDWKALAKSYDLAEHVSGFLAWNAQQMLAPEAFTVATNQAPTSRAAKPAAAKIEELATWRKNRESRRRGAARKTSR
jgi:hypothetical protein